MPALRFAKSMSTRTGRCGVALKRVVAVPRAARQWVILPRDLRTWARADRGSTNGVPMNYQFRWSVLIHRASTVFVIAVPISFLWELCQRPLYVGMADTPESFFHSFVASLGDGLLTLLIYGVTWGVFRRGDALGHVGADRWGVILLTGFVVGLAVEWIGLRVLHRWAYTMAMPLIDGLGLGWVPVLQMMLIPPVVFGLDRLLRRVRRPAENRKK